MKLYSIRNMVAVALLCWLFGFLSLQPSFSALDETICSAADQAGCTGANVRVNSNEELKALSDRAPRLLTGISGVNAFTACAAIPITGYVDGAQFLVAVPADNTAATTLNICGVGVRAWVNSQGLAHATGDVKAATRYLVQWRHGNNRFETVGGGAGGVGGGAATNLPFVTAVASGALSDERTLTAGSGISLTDGGANTTLTVGVATSGIANSNLANAPANTFKANNTGVAAAPTDITVAQAKTLLAYQASEVTNTPAGNVAAAQVQAAINELDTEKQAADADLSALAGQAGTGVYVITGAGTGATRTLTGTAAEITVTNGNGVSGDPTVSLPAALTFTGKTVTGGTFSGPQFTGNAAVANGGVLRFNEDTGNGSNFLELRRPVALAADVTCQIDANGRIPDSCVGDGVDAGAGGGSGDVVGPASAVDNTLPRYDGTTGKIIQGSGVEVTDANEMQLPLVASPTAAAADSVKIFADKKAGRVLPTAVGPSGLEMILQVNIFSNKIARWNPPGNATTVPGVDGIAAPTALGTATARNVATTNLATRARRLGYVSAATAAAFAGHYSTAAQFTIGATGDIGGFYYVTRFVPSNAAAVTGERLFIGLRNAVSAPTNVEPNTLTNAVGVCQLSTSNNLHICSGGSAAQAALDLGANFPANTLSADLYELALFAPPNTQVIHYQVTRVNTGQVATGTLNGTVGTAIPAATTFLAHAAWKTNNATLLAVGLDVVSLYIETDN